MAAERQDKNRFFREQFPLQFILFRFHFIVKAFLQPRVYFHRISASKTVGELINMRVISGVIATADVISRLLSDFA